MLSLHVKLSWTHSGGRAIKSFCELFLNVYLLTVTVGCTWQASIWNTICKNKINPKKVSIFISHESRHGHSQKFSILITFVRKQWKKNAAVILLIQVAPSHVSTKHDSPPYTPNTSFYLLFSMTELAPVYISATTNACMEQLHTPNWF